jgi:hypothetical protein
MSSYGKNNGFYIVPVNNGYMNLGMTLYVLLTRVMNGLDLKESV